MTVDIPKTESRKNPLRIVLVFAFVLGAYYVASFAKAVYGKGSDTLLSEKTGVVTAFLLIVAFIIAYYRKLIHAWWIALVFFPVVWSIHQFLYDDDIPWWGIIGIYFFWFVYFFTYLTERYESYKKYIGRDETLGLLEVDVEGESTNLNVQKNPLSTLFGAFIILVAFNMVVCVKVVYSQSVEILLSERLDAVAQLLVSAAFIVSYIRKSIFAWWIALFFGPVVSLVFSLVNPDAVGLKIVIIGVVIWIIFGCAYLAKRYKPYRNYVRKLGTGINE
jgi:hypothetical protein